MASDFEMWQFQAKLLKSGTSSLLNCLFSGYIKSLYDRGQEGALQVQQAEGVYGKV